MTRTSIPATNTSNPAQELEALVAKIDSLTQLSLEMTRLCIDAQGVVPDIALSKQSLELTQACLDVKSQVRPIVNRVLAATAPKSAPLPSPHQPLPSSGSGAFPSRPTNLMRRFPPVLVTISLGKWFALDANPGCTLAPFVSNTSFSTQANTMLNGVPNQFRRKKGSRVEALAYYRLLYANGEVQKWNEAVPPRVSPAAPTTPPVVPVESSLALPSLCIPIFLLEHC
ncbi:hypothetical protein B0H13DRAFT_1883538 [Mycena leptocephala]|nr:hypothetical protein B0H13DRAFT_1883538 [Mycena leptocephala]